MLSTTRGGPLLIVEDHPDIREGLIEFVGDHGFEAVGASNGLEALAQLRTIAGVRVVLLDLMMPVMDGRAFRRAQLADPQLASIPVILISAAPNAHEVAHELGAVAHFQKPVDWTAALAALEPYR